MAVGGPLRSLELERKALKLFAEVVDVESSQRDAWLDAMCDGDLELRSRLEELIAADTEDVVLATAGGFTALNRVDEAPEIEGYEIVRRIGIGGMGDVYEAQRVDGHFSQRVAIKIVRAPFSSKQLLDCWTAG